MESSVAERKAEEDEDAEEEEEDDDEVNVSRMVWKSGTWSR